MKSNQRSTVISTYLRLFQRNSILLVMGISFVCSSALALLVVYISDVAIWSGAFWLTMVSGGVLLSVINVCMFHIVTRPFNSMLQELKTAVDDPGNALRTAAKDTYKDGFNDVLKLLAELAVPKKESVIISDKSEDILYTALDQTNSGIVILNPDHEIIYSNKKAPVRVNAEGKKVIDLMFFEDETIDTWLKDADTKSVHSEHMWIRIADKPPGERGRHIYDITGSYQKNKPAETVLTFFDRTATYAPEEDDLDFISFAAHELRGPITVIRGYLDVLDMELADVLQSDQAELLKRLIVSSNRLSSYVNNILNASRYDRRHFKIYPTEETVMNIYNTIREDMQLRAISQNRMLTIEISDSLPTVAADKNSIGEVLSNLIDNAIKYSNEGGQVIVKTKILSGFIEVSIVDRGIGMPSSVLPNLFHKFYRSHRSRETVAGTGIGLYISKAIVESHGGTIEVRSTESEGSTFAFTLPIYDTVADKIKAGNNSNQYLIERSGGWIRNHSMYRG